MSARGAHIHNGRWRGLFRIADAPPTDDRAASPQARPPYWLLWSTGAVAFVLAAVAFVLWGLTGAATLLDMIVAFCT